MRFLILTLWTLASSTYGQQPSAASRQIAYQSLGDVEPQELSGPGQSVMFDSFDLSPDGRYLALLYEMSTMRGGVMASSEAWAAVWDADVRKITTHRRLFENDLKPPTRMPTLMVRCLTRISSICSGCEET